MKKILLYILINYSLLVVNGFGQYQVEWIRTYPGRIHSSAIDSTGNVYITGDNEGNYFLLKYSNNGYLIWQRAISMNNNLNKQRSNPEYQNLNQPNQYNNKYFINDFSNKIKTGDGNGCMAADSLGNVFISWSNGNGFLYIYKYDSSGTQKWRRLYNDTKPDWPKDLALDYDGNVIVIGERGLSFTEFLTLKYSSSGNLIWNKIYYDTIGGFPNKISVDLNNNIYIAGQILTNNTFWDMINIKYNNEGVLQWVSRYNDTLNSGDLAYSICVDKYGNSYVTGLMTVRLRPNYATDAIGTIKYTPQGDSVWVRIFHNNDSLQNNYGTDIITDNSGNVYVSGMTTGNITFSLAAYATIKYDNNGNMLWIKFNSGDYPPNDITLDKNKNVYVTGGYNMTTVIYDSTGNKIWSMSYPSSTSTNGGLKLLFDKNNNLFIPGGVSIDSTILIKVSKTTSIHSISENIPDIYRLYQNYPNPFNPSSVIRFQLPVVSNVVLKVYDAMGREVQTLLNENLNSGTYSVEFNGEGLSSGIYFYKIEVRSSKSSTGKFTDVKRMVLLK
ncbi:MAG: T9SS type A sorting domain-containing protein [Candidatus Kapaibacterium sp.]